MFIPSKKLFFLGVILVTIFCYSVIVATANLDRNHYLPYVVADLDTPQPTPSPTLTFTATPLPATLTATPTRPMNTATAPATGEPTATPTARSTEMVPSPTPRPGGNLLENPNFDYDLSGWQQVHHIWMHSHKPANPSPNDSAAKMGQDNGGDGWQPGEKDWLYQDFTAPSNNTLIFRITEIQHGYDRAEVRIYGRVADQWEEIWFRPEPDAPPATSQYDWHTFTYTIPGGYSEYRLEFFAKMAAPSDGWKFTLLNLSAP